MFMRSAQPFLPVSWFKQEDREPVHMSGQRSKAKFKDAKLRKVGALTIFIAVAAVGTDGLNAQQSNSAHMTREQGLPYAIRIISETAKAGMAIPSALTGLYQDWDRKNGEWYSRRLYSNEKTDRRWHLLRKPRDFKLAVPGREQRLVFIDADGREREWVYDPYRRKIRLKNDNPATEILLQSGAPQKLVDWGVLKKEVLDRLDERDREIVKRWEKHRYTKASWVYADEEGAKIWSEMLKTMREKLDSRSTLKERISRGENPCTTFSDDTLTAITNRLNQEMEPRTNLSGSTIASLISQLGEQQIFTEEQKAGLLNCICRVHSGKTSTVSVWYQRTSYDASPSCKDITNGPCIGQGMGCGRTRFIPDEKALKACGASQKIAEAFCKMRAGIGR